uniref:Uncharacterized protein n=1 Tax=Anguilla anguilla TaxID=7936 RepID=A0A0E9UVR5_ANGAN
MQLVLMKPVKGLFHKVYWSFQQQGMRF